MVLILFIAVIAVLAFGPTRVTRLLCLTARLGMGAAAFIGGALMVDQLAPDDGLATIVGGAFSALCVLWLTRTRKRVVVAHAPRPPHDPLLHTAQHARLDATERALAHAARDQHGAAAAEWLMFWRRRVPDLIVAARAVYEDSDGAGKARVVARLSGHLTGIIAEAERRIATAQAARADVFSIRGIHADRRVRDE